MKQSRIELNGITEDAETGAITVKFTYNGNGVLGLDWGGMSKVFASRADLAEYVSNAEAALDEDLMVALVLSKGVKADPTCGATFRNYFGGILPKTAVVDFEGSGTAISV